MHAGVLMAANPLLRSGPSNVSGDTKMQLAHAWPSGVERNALHGPVAVVPKQAFAKSAICWSVHFPWWVEGGVHPTTKGFELGLQLPEGGSVQVPPSTADATVGPEMGTQAGGPPASAVAEPVVAASDRPVSA
jgi:hypothetical protein